MNNLVQAKELAQRYANRENKKFAVLNLNQFSPLYVVREFDERVTAVWVAEPQHG